MAIKQAVLSVPLTNSQDASSFSLMPLSMVKPGTEVSVQSVKGKDEVKRFLASLGFVENAPVTVVTELGGNVIVSIKGTRVAVSKAMASRIYAQ